MGINGNLYTLLRNYILNRKQKVVLNGKMSDWAYPNAGVPQGSVLGPLLFLIFINDINLDLDIPMYMFADDITLICQLKNLQDLEQILNRNLKNLRKWSKIWRVKFSTVKTKCMMFSNIKIDQMPTIKLGDEILEFVENHKLLGIILNKKMSWDNHIDFIYSSTNKCVGLLQKTSFLIPRKAKEKIDKSFIKPIIEYGNIIYSNSTITKLNLLDKLQRRCAVICLNSYKLTETVKLYRELGWDTLEHRRKKHKLCLMYKIIKKMTPTYLHNLLPQPSQHTYATRNINNLKHIKCRTSRYRSSFLPSMILAWNKLPTNIKESATLNIFKTICSEKTEKPQYKHICTGPGYRHHTRIRLGLSALNQQRFTYNLIETKFCDNCRDKDESPKHYFLECPQYEIFRITLLRQ